MSEDSLTPRARPRRISTILAAGLLLAALALVVIYTNRAAFVSPLALVVVAAIGIAALFLQIRMHPDLQLALEKTSFARSSLWINAVGVVFATLAVFGDFFRVSAMILRMATLAAVLCFAVSGAIVLGTLRRRR
jgi:hypothetical protein